MKDGEVTGSIPVSPLRTRRIERVDAARRKALEELCRRRPSEPLKDGAHLVVYHALRCLCPTCKRIITWSDGDEQGIITGECCRLVFRLFPWTVKVRIEDTRPESLLPPHRDHYFPIDIDLMDYAVEPPAPPEPG